MKKLIALLLVFVLVLSGCYKEEYYEEIDYEEVEKRKYIEAYNEGYKDAVAQIGENIYEYLDIIREESEMYVSENLPEDQGFAYDEICWAIFPYLYGEEYGEHDEEQFYYAVMQLYYFYDSFYENECHRRSSFYSWQDKRFEEDYN